MGVSENSEYQKLDFSIDVDDLYKEYLEIIKPHLLDAPSTMSAISYFDRGLNSSEKWNIASQEDFENLTVRDSDSILYRPIQCLKGLSLTYPIDSSKEELAINRVGTFSSGLRQKYLDQNWLPYPEFEQLKLFKILSELPITDIRHIRVLTVPENSFLFIHNDQQDLDSTLESKGYKCFAIQVHAVDRKLKIKHYDNVNEANDNVFVFTDAALHGIPKGKEEYVIYRITCKFL